MGYRPVDHDPQCDTEILYQLKEKPLGPNLASQSNSIIRPSSIEDVMVRSFTLLQLVSYLFYLLEQGLSSCDMGENKDIALRTVRQYHWGCHTLIKRQHYSAEAE